MLGNTIASIMFTFRNKTRLFPSPFHVFISLRHTLAVVLRGDYVAACSTAFRSATEENDSGGHVDGTYPTKMAQPNSTADWLRILVTSPDR